LKPVLAFTSGDPGGIGPETIVKAAADRRVSAVCRPLFIGPLAAFQKAGWRPSLGPVLDTGGAERGPYLHMPASRNGQESFTAVRLAVKLALAGKIGGVVTAPISKEAWAMAGTGFLGHTEFLRHNCNAPEAVMCFIAGRTRCALVTEHTPVAKLSSALTRARVEAACRAFGRELGKLGLRRPRLALCALNPHAGDGGAIGNEEIKTLLPAVAALNKSGLEITGPLPADAAWKRHLSGEWDGIVCLYHDQALIPLKTAVKNAAAHWTCGLPIVRTSPAHGTAFDIAGRGKADPASAIEAALFATKLAAAGR